MAGILPGEWCGKKVPWFVFLKGVLTLFYVGIRMLIHFAFSREDFLDLSPQTSGGWKWTMLFLPLIMVAALALRFPTLSAYPFQDELAVECNSMVMGAGGTIHPFTRNWPPLVYYLQIGTAKALHSFGLCPSPTEALMAAGLDGFDTPGPYLRMCRALSAFYALVALLFAALLGRRLVGEAVGLWAALFLAAAPLHVAVSRLATTDVLCTALVVGSLWLAAEGYVRGGRLSWLVGAALVAGGAAGAKYLGGMALVAPVMVVLWPPTARDLKVRLRGVVLVGLGGLAGLLITVPGMLVMPAEYLQGLGQHAADAKAGWEFFRGVELPGYLYHPLVSFTWGMGGALAGFAGLVGFAVLCCQRPGARLVLASFGLTWFLVVGYTGVLYARYWAPFLPLLCLGLAWGAITVSRRRPMLGHIALSLVLVWSLIGDVPRALAMKGMDTRMEMKRVLGTTVPLQRKIATLYPLWQDPVTTATVMAQLEIGDAARRQALVSKAATIAPVQFAHLLWDSAYPAIDPRLFKLQHVSVKDQGLTFSLRQLKEQGVTHYLWSAFRDGMVEQAGPGVFPERCNFLKQLKEACGDPEVVVDPGGSGGGLPLAEEETRSVWSDDARRPGPLLKLYALP